MLYRKSRLRLPLAPVLASLLRADGGGWCLHIGFLNFEMFIFCVLGVDYFVFFVLEPVELTSGRSG